MTTITQVQAKLHRLLTTVADETAKQSGFIQRQRKLTGGQFVQAVVFGWLHQPSATRKQLHQALLQTGVKMSAPGFEARFTQVAADFLRTMVEQAMTLMVEAQVESPLLNRFTGVYLSDSTRLEGAAEALKVATRLELQRGGLTWTLEAVETHDNARGVMHAPLPTGSLHIGDLGFFDLQRFAQWQRDGVDWLTRYKGRTRLFHPDGQPLAVSTLLRRHTRLVHQPVQVGHLKVPMWLVAQPVCPAVYRQRLRRLRRSASRKQATVSRLQKDLARWTIYLTSLPNLSFEQLHTLYRARWQIERLFKRWKTLAKLDTSRSADPLRQRCERYAKLLAVLIAHWLSLATAWHLPLSRDGAFVLCQHYAPCFYLACFRFPALLSPLLTLLEALLPSLALNRRKKAPNAYDLWTLFDAAA